MNKTVVLTIVLLLLSSCGGLGESNTELSTDLDGMAAPSGTIPLASQQIIRLPLSIWQVKSQSHPEVSSNLTPEQINEYVRRANLVWAPANIVFFIDTIAQVNLDPASAQGFSDYLQSTSPAQRESREAVDLLFSSGQYNGLQGDLNIILMPEFGRSPGVAILPLSMMFLSEFGVQNGIPNHNILAHELGHALKLAHVNLLPEACNIMVAGSCLASTLTNTENGLLIKKFNQCQIDIARNIGSANFASALDPTSEQCLSVEPVRSDGLSISNQNTVF